MTKGFVPERNGGTGEYGEVENANALNENIQKVGEMIVNCNAGYNLDHLQL